MRRIRMFSVFGPEPPSAPAWQVELDENSRLLHERTERYLLRLRNLAAAQGASLGIVLVTFRQQLGEMGPGNAPEAFGQRWMRWGMDHEVPVIDMYPAIRALPDPFSLFWRWDYHYNVRGNHVIADAAMELLRGGLLPLD